jgi:acyl dehydratase
MTMSDVSSALDFHRYEGLEAGPALVARDEVNQAMIRHWCDAMGDNNPIYLDREAARREGYPDVVAPPAMLQAWTMPGYGRQNTTGGTLGELYRELNAAGYTTVVATDCEQEYLRYATIGDLLTATEHIQSITDEKKTKLGVGRFVTTLRTYTVQSGEIIAYMKWTILFFKPTPVEG